MDSVFEYHIKSSILKQKGNNFQNFIDELYIKKYGSRFTPLKQKRDKGSDGILDNIMVIAAYAPENMRLREFKKKVSDDYGKYKKNWFDKYPKWRFIYNGEITAEMEKHISSLAINIEKWTINHLMDAVNSLNWPQKRDIANYLGMDEVYFINDILKNVVDDLMRNENECIDKWSGDKPCYIEDKIRLNFCLEDIDGAIVMYEEAIPYLTELKNVLKSYTDVDVSALKDKVLVAYKKLDGGFKKRFEVLIEDLSERNKNDDLYKYYVKVVLIYCFETCLIGKRTEGELNHDKATA